MKSHEVIAGLKSLIKDRESFLSEKTDDGIFLEDIRYLKEAIKIIIEKNKIEFDLDEMGCPMCGGKNDYILITSNGRYKRYQCNCGVKIKVKIIKEIKEVTK